MRPSESSNGKFPSWLAEASDLTDVVGDIAAVVGAKTDAAAAAADFLRKQADGAEPMKQSLSTFVHVRFVRDGMVVVGIENWHENGRLVAPQFAPLHVEQLPSPSVDDFAWPAVVDSPSVAARTGIGHALLLHHGRRERRSP